MYKVKPKVKGGRKHYIKLNLKGLNHDFGQILFYFLFTVFVMLSKCIFFINQKKSVISIVESKLTIHANVNEVRSCFCLDWFNIPVTVLFSS